MDMISKFIAILTVIILVMVGVFYSFGAEKDASVMDVTVDVLLDGDGYWHITYVNGTFREANRISIPKGGEIKVPGIIANVIYDGKMIGYWESVSLDPTVPRNSTKTYNFTVGLFENPLEGENASISVRTIGFVGEELDSFKTRVKVEYKSAVGQN